MTPTSQPTVNGSTPTSIITSTGVTISSGHPKFDAFMQVLEALVPVALAGASPFLGVKATTIAFSEEPIAQALLAALAKL